ncbi:MAG: DeoR/GlpR family DNA-binding transcription regulator [Bacteroidota bacterium]|nr:DeoR/GlpR family DNA-binding transcription regulator [Bacteroidota bacterium]
MQGEERKRAILNKVQESKSVEVEDLAIEFNVSTMTIRRDLAELDKKGLLVRTHGGALKTENEINVFSNFDLRIGDNKEKKIEICKIAARFIQDNDILFLDCGSTLFHLSTLMGNFKNLRVITNSLPIVSELLNYPNIKVNLIGGEMDPNRKATYGRISSENIQEYHATKAFVGADGVSITGGISSYDEKESTITKSFIANADKVFLLCDSTKLEKNSFVKFASIQNIDCLITDSKASKEHISLYANNNIKIVYS